MRVPITDRPKKVDSRHEFGHFESDTVVGASPSKRCIDTQVERKSRRLFARFVFCQIFVGRFGVSFSPFERLFLGRFGFGQSCGLSVIA